ncbi:MAG: type II toxin-antitoxin system VapC family toxin [Terracidiphilus sp.]
MRGYLLDTNIPSELTRPHPQPSVSEWLDNADDEQLYFSVISLGEIVKGISALPASKRRTELQDWLDGTLRLWFGDRILSINAPIAERWGAMAGQCKSKGRPLKVADGLIAATALLHDLAVVTRNARDFEELGVEIVNPWD